MKKWLALLLLILVVVGGYIAGPFMTIHAIRTAVREQDAAELSRHIDFPALRTSFRQQIDDYLARRAGAQVQASAIGSLALGVASQMAGGVSDALATPAGLAAVLQGRTLLHRLTTLGAEDATRSKPTSPPDPLQGARYAFATPSIFTATVLNSDGEPVIFVLTRDGLRWKLTDVRLPISGAGDAAAGLTPD